MISEDGDRRLEEGELPSSSSWEERAEQLFSLCDRECKGFVTKRDLQRLWGELPLGPDELEGVFDSLDQDGNGFLTLQEFTDGFGHHLGLVVEFRADCDTKHYSEEEDANGGDCEEQNTVDDGSLTSQQIDEILSCLAKHDFDMSSSVVESVWREICQDDSTEEGIGLGRLVTALLQELARVKAEQTHLEAALNSKTEQYNQQVAHLYEELESQIRGEQNKMATERNEKGSRALAALEEEVREREAALKALQEDHAALKEKLENLMADDSATKQENNRLIQHLSKLELDLGIKEKEVEELSSTVKHMRRNSKDEKKRRAHQALKVSEGISLERESLVSQLDLLRSINNQLRDESDTSDSSRPNRPKKEMLDQMTISAPVPATRTAFNVSTAEINPQTNSLSGHPSSDEGSPVRDSMSPQTTPPVTEVEYDESYFQNSEMNANSTAIHALMTSSPETSLLEELLQQPNLCTSCGGKISGKSETVTSPKPRVTFNMTDSITQTSPILPRRFLYHDDLINSDLQSSTKSPDDIMAVADGAGPIDNPNSDTSNVSKPKSCLKTHKEPDVTKTCHCGRIVAQQSSQPADHSSTVILYHHGQSSSPPDLLPKNHSAGAYIHTRHSHHSHAYLPVNHLNSQSTNTLLESLPPLHDCKVETCSIATQSEDFLSSICNGDEELIAEATKETQMGYNSMDAYEIDTSSETRSESLLQHHEQHLQQQQQQATTTPSRIDEQLNNLRNLKDNIKNYIHEKSNVFSRDNTKNGEEKRSSDAKAEDVIKMIKDTSLLTTRIFKIVFIGDSGVGKTTFIHRASSGEFRGDFATTVGVDYRLMEVRIGGIQTMLQLWDTAGQERYKAITRQYYRKADGVILMYDVTSERSYLSLTNWISSVREHGNDMMMAIIGNKKDLQKARQISIDMASKLAKAHNSLMYECSAVTGCGVKEAMKHLAGILTTDQQHDIDTSSTLTLHQSPKSSSNCC